MTRRLRGSAVGALAVALAASQVCAEHTQKWIARGEAEFKKGEPRNVVLTSQGELRLSRELKTLVTDDPQLETVLALAEGKDGVLYVGSGGGAEGARILAVREGKAEVVRTLGEGELISAMAVDADGRLLVAISGEHGKVLRVSTSDAKAEPETVFAEEGVQYVWAIGFSPEGGLYVATGPEGKLYLVGKEPGAKAEAVFESEASNLTSMAIAPDGRVYLGSDPDGLVYRWDPKTKEASVLLDAAESEISALALDKQGNLFVAAGAASEPGLAAGGGESPFPGSRGRPDPLSPERRDPDLPEPPMTPPEPQPKKDPKPEAGEPGISARYWGGRNRGGRQLSPLPFPLPGMMRAPIVLPSGGASEDGGEGSAVYRIDAEGFVTEVFRAPLTIYTLVERDGLVLLGTGTEGLIYQLDLARDEVGQIARAQGKDVTALLPRRDGSIAVGISNGGAVAQLSSGLAAQGTYISEILDATVVARLGTMRLEGSLPEGSSLTVSTRSGNTAEPSDTGWSKWTVEVPAAHYVKIESPAARYFQYRLTFKPVGEGAAARAATIREVEASYLRPNMPPKITSLTVTDPHLPQGETPNAGGGNLFGNNGGGGPPRNEAIKSIAWEAEDPNEDSVVYSLQYRPIDSDDWRPLKDKIETLSFVWDTRGIPDGRYQVRLLASDASDNATGSAKTAARVSDIFLVDNTPPTATTPTTEVKDGVVTLTLSVRDAASTVVGVSYRVDAEEGWRAGQARDRMFDSPAEEVVVMTEKLSPGKHVIQVRVVDDRGNAGFQTVLVTVP